MINDRIREAYERLAPHYDRHIDHKPHNAFYDRPKMLTLFGNVTGTSLLDAGPENTQRS